MSENYVQEIRVGDQLDGPSCHVCGAIMVAQYTSSISDPDAPIAYWKCLSCGATTEASWNHAN